MWAPQFGWEFKGFYVIFVYSTIPNISHSSLLSYKSIDSNIKAHFDHYLIQLNAFDMKHTWSWLFLLLCFFEEKYCHIKKNCQWNGSNRAERKPQGT